VSGLDRPADDDVFSAYLDGELAPVERAAFEARLAADADARAELDDVAEVRTLVRGLGAVAPPAGFVDELLAIGAAEAAEEDTDDEPGTVAPAADLAAARTHRRGRSRFAALAVGAAAAVALVVAVVVPKQSSNRPALATEVRVHQAGAAASGDPVSGLAPLATPLRFGR
jgi:anti-sigma factor RsiW